MHTLDFQVKQADPRGHLTASQALAIAREYIMSKAPGLLEEHGGTIKLKLTWAMKLVSRISEREKELELGLPAGTLSNMTSKSFARTLFPCKRCLISKFIYQRDYEFVWLELLRTFSWTNVDTQYAVFAKPLSMLLIESGVSVQSSFLFRDDVERYSKYA